MSEVNKCPPDFGEVGAAPDNEPNKPSILDILQCRNNILRAELTERNAELAALREELAKLKQVTNFSDAVACVFDMLKYAAANTSSREWDDQLEDLAQDVIEFAPEYKKQWQDICKLQQRLTYAERNAQNSEVAYKAAIEKQEELREELVRMTEGRDGLRLALDEANKIIAWQRDEKPDLARLADAERRNALMTDLLDSISKCYAATMSLYTLDKIAAVLTKPTELGASEVAKQALRMENQRITPARFKCLACGEYHEGSGNLPCPKMSPMSGGKP